MSIFSAAKCLIYPPQMPSAPSFSSYVPVEEVIEQVRTHADIFTLGRTFRRNGTEFCVCSYVPGKSLKNSSGLYLTQHEAIELEYCDSIGVIHRIVYEGEQLPYVAKRFGTL
jgi:hypothetical protein